MTSTLTDQNALRQASAFAEKTAPARNGKNLNGLMAGLFGLMLWPVLATATTAVNEGPLPDEPRIILPDSTSVAIPIPRPDPSLMLPEAPTYMVLPNHGLTGKACFRRQH